MARRRLSQLSNLTCPAVLLLKNRRCCVLNAIDHRRKEVELIIPEGSMLNPKYPAAVVAGNVETSQCMTDALFGALGVMAAAQGTMNNLTFGDDTYQYYETLCGGSGAGPDGGSRGRQPVAAVRRRGAGRGAW